MRKLIHTLLEFATGAERLGFTDAAPEHVKKQCEALEKRRATLEECAEQVVWHLKNSRPAAAQQVAENLLKKLQ